MKLLCVGATPAYLSRTCVLVRLDRTSTVVFLDHMGFQFNFDKSSYRSFALCQPERARIDDIDVPLPVRHGGLTATPRHQTCKCQ